MRRPVEEVAGWSEDELCWWWARSEIRPMEDDRELMLRHAAALNATSVVEKKSQKKTFAMIVPESKK